MRRPTRSAMTPDSVTATRQTSAPTSSITRKRTGGSPEVSTNHDKGNTVTRWNNAKLASGANAPSTTVPPSSRTSAESDDGCSSRLSNSCWNPGVEISRSRANNATTLMTKATKKGKRQPQSRKSAVLSALSRYAKTAAATNKPTGAPSCGIIANQPRRPAGALSDSSAGRPSQVPPSAKPCPMRNSASRMTAQAPACAWLGTKAIAAVDPPSRNIAAVSLTPRPCLRSIQMKASAPIGRATKASAKSANE